MIQSIDSRKLINKEVLSNKNLIDAFQFIKLPGVVVLGTVLLGLYSFWTVNPLYTLLSILTVPILMKLLWRKNEPPVLFFGVLFQWLSVTIKVFYANSQNLPFSEAHVYPAVPTTIEKAFILSLIGLLAFSLGLHLPIRKIRFKYQTSLTTLIQQYNTRKVTYAYLMLFLAMPFLKVMAYIVPGLQQPILKALELKWSFFYLLYMVVTLKKENRQNFYVILLVEIVLGFTGYFSSFKDFILIFLVSYLTFGLNLKPLQYIFIAISGAFTFNLAIIWTYVKPEYRQFLSGGETAQVVTVSKTDALTKLGDLYEKMTPENFEEATVDLINRISYIEYFSATINYVPGDMPYQEGEIWAGALQHVLLPRILFPNKPIIDDSEQTAQYTGMFVSGKDTGTSISLGYMAESYVDFGEVYMFIPIFLLGILVGIIYRYLLSNAVNQLWGYALVIPIYFITNVNGTAIAKIMGGVVMYFLTTFLLNRFVLKNFDRLLK